MTLLFLSEYQNIHLPYFEKRKLSGELRIFLNLRQIKHFLRQKFPNPNTGWFYCTYSSKEYIHKKGLQKRTFSIHMEEEMSTQTEEFNFGEGTFASNSLVAHGLSRSPTAISAVVNI